MRACAPGAHMRAAVSLSVRACVLAVRCTRLNVRRLVAHRHARDARQVHERHGQYVRAANLEPYLLLADALVVARLTVRLRLNLGAVAPRKGASAPCPPAGHASACSIARRIASKSVNTSPGRCRNSPYSSGLPGAAGVYTSCSTSGRRVQMSVPRGRKSRPTCGAERRHVVTQTGV